MTGPARDRRAARAAVAGGVLTLGLLGAICGRVWWAHRLSRRVTGLPPSVKTDDGVLLHLETDGREDRGVSFVFAHGFASSSAEYAAQREALKDHGRLVFFDQRGHAGSGWRSFRRAGVDRLARDLGQVIDETTGSDRVILVAHSMGGMASLALAEQRPDLFREKIAALALLSTTAGDLLQEQMSPRAERFALRTGLARGAAWSMWFVAPLLDVARPFQHRAGRRWLRRRLFGPGSPPAWALDAMQRSWRQAPQAVAGAFYPDLVEFNRVRDLDCLRQVPVLVLSGTADVTIPKRHSEFLSRRIGPQAELVLVPKAGHMVNMSRPETVNEALLRLIGRAGLEPVQS